MRLRRGSGLAATPDPDQRRRAEVVGRPVVPLRRRAARDSTRGRQLQPGKSADPGDAGEVASGFQLPAFALSSQSPAQRQAGSLVMRSISRIELVPESPAPDSLLDGSRSPLR